MQTATIVIKASTQNNIIFKHNIIDVNTLHPHIGVLRLLVPGVHTKN